MPAERSRLRPRSPRSASSRRLGPPASHHGRDPLSSRRRHLAAAGRSPASRGQRGTEAPEVEARCPTRPQSPAGRATQGSRRCGRGARAVMNAGLHLGVPGHAALLVYAYSTPYGSLARDHAPASGVRKTRHTCRFDSALEPFLLRGEATASDRPARRLFRSGEGDSRHSLPPRAFGRRRHGGDCHGAHLIGAWISVTSVRRLAAPTCRRKAAPWGCRGGTSGRSPCRERSRSSCSPDQPALWARSTCQTSHPSLS